MSNRYKSKAKAPADGPSPPQTIRRRLYGEKDRLMTDSLQQPISEEGGDARKTMIPGLSNYGRAYDTIIFAGSDRFLEGSAADSPTAVQTPDTSTPRATSMAFPFLAATVPTTVKSCIAQIPEQEVGRRCLMAYYRYFAWLTLDLTLEHKYFPYAEVLRLDRQLEVSPDRNIRKLTASQQFTLAVLASANFLFLHRPYFARAVQDPEPVKAAFGHSYLAVMEHSSYHLFAAAASLGSLVINCPSSPLVPFAVSHLDRATQVYGSVRHRLSSGFITQNHQMLCSLKTRIETGSRPAFTTIPGVSLASTSGTLDQYLLDWEKRLVDSHLPVLSAQKDDANSTSAAPPYNPLYPIQLTTSPAPPASMLDASVDTSTDWVAGLDPAKEEGKDQQEKEKEANKDAEERRKQGRRIESEGFNKSGAHGQTGHSFCWLTIGLPPCDLMTPP
ncbi:hypothetical protein EHS25_000188 [Saitozyma podzolica]|uniref:Transcription factor domain-containing protein n=1 Tax=Saitozyma podzolica TaxID=1890683 RepID=A0A427YVJ7_9TREE|nr:hypothetical protein EHS25_000188 [Saitozyma podzolica]